MCAACADFINGLAAPHSNVFVASSVSWPSINEHHHQRLMWVKIKKYCQWKKAVKQTRLPFTGLYSSFWTNIKNKCSFELPSVCFFFFF